MPLVETVALAIGPAVAKAVLKLWLGDGLPNTAASNAIDLVKRKVEDMLAQNKADLQIQRIGEQIAVRLHPVFDHDGISLGEEERGVVALEFARTLSIADITSKLLVDANLDADILARHLLYVANASVRLFSAAEMALYERLIRESAKEIMTVANSLTGFERYFSASVLQGMDNVLAAVAKLIATPSQEATQFESRYRAVVKQNLDKVEVFGLPQLDTLTRRQSLSVAYISLDVSQQDRIVASREHTDDVFEYKKSKDVMLFERRKIGKLDVVSGPADSLLATSRRIVIRGQAGSGKSTLMQWIAVRSAARDFPQHLAHLNDTVPFFIRLRSCVKSGFPRPEEFVSQIATMIVGDMPHGWVHDQLESGRAIVLIDGVDELPRDQRSVMLDHLKQLMSTYRLPFYIVTSRPAALKAEEWLEWQEWTKQENFVEANLDPMNTNQVEVFIDHWHLALEKSLSEEEERLEVRAQPAALKRLLRQRPPLQRLASNPLLCSMICALHRERQQNLPAERIALYKACVEMLLSRRDEGRKINLPDYPNLTSEQKLIVIQDFAYWMLQNGYSDVEFHDAEARFEGLLPGLNLQSVTGESIRRLLVQRTSLLREPVEGRVDFAHRTFQEFLAAQAALNNNDLGVLIKNCRDDQWRETIILAAGEARPKECEKLLRGLIDRAEKLQLARNRNQIYLLALACLETSVFVSPEARKFVLERASVVFPPRDDDEAKMVARAGDPAIPLLLPRDDMKADTAACCISALAYIGTDRAMQAIAEYTKDNRYLVGNALGRAWRSFDSAEYGRTVMGRMNEINVVEMSDDVIPYIAHSTALMVDSGRVNFKSIAAFPNLKSLYVANSTLCEVASLALMTNLTEFAFLDAVFDFTTPSRSPEFSDLTVFGKLPGLKRLWLWGISSRDISPLSKLGKLGTLSLSRSPVRDITPLVKLHELRTLELRNLLTVDFEPLSRLHNLRSLSIVQKQAIDFAVIGRLTNLTELDLSGVQSEDLGLLSGLTNLRKLSFEGSLISELAPLCHMTTLTVLRAPGCPICDLAPLAYLKDLEELDISYSSVTDLTPVRQLEKLRELDIAHSHVNDLTPLARLSGLKRLRVSDSQGLDLSPLATIKNLEIEII